MTISGNTWLHRAPYHSGHSRSRSRLAAVPDAVRAQEFPTPVCCLYRVFALAPGRIGAVRFDAFAGLIAPSALTLARRTPG